MTAKTSVSLFGMLIVSIAMFGLPYIWNLTYGSVSASPFNATEEAKANPDSFDIKAQLKANKDAFSKFGKDYETYISLGEDLNLGDGINDKTCQKNGTVIWKNDSNNADLTLHGDMIK